MNYPNKYINRTYKKKFIKEVVSSFERKIGIDVSLYIFSFIKKNSFKCSLCDSNIYHKFSYCLKHNCNSIMCFKCYKITSKFNADRPYCENHFTRPIKINNGRNTYLKKRLIQKMKNKMKDKNINLIEYVYRPKPHKDFIHQFFTYNKNKDGGKIKFPSKKVIKPNFTFVIRDNTLIVVITDNIYDTYDYYISDYFLY